MAGAKGEGCNGEFQRLHVAHLYIYSYVCMRLRLLRFPGVGRCLERWHAHREPTSVYASLGNKPAPECQPEPARQPEPTHFLRCCRRQRDKPTAYCLS